MVTNDCPCGYHPSTDLVFSVYADDGRWPQDGTPWWSRPLPMPEGVRVTYPSRCPYEREQALQQTLREHPGKVVVG